MCITWNSNQHHLSHPHQMTIRTKPHINSCLNHQLTISPLIPTLANLREKYVWEYHVLSTLLCMGLTSVYKASQAQSRITPTHTQMPHLCNCHSMPSVVMTMLHAPWQHTKLVVVFIIVIITQPNTHSPLVDKHGCHQRDSDYHNDSINNKACYETTLESSIRSCEQIRRRRKY